MVLKVIILPALLAAFAVLFLLACIGEKEHNFKSKVLYAAVSVVLFVLLLVSTRT